MSEAPPCARQIALAAIVALYRRRLRRRRWARVLEELVRSEIARLSHARRLEQRDAPVA